MWGASLLRGGGRPLRGKIAVITGGTRGVGRALAIQLAQEGVSVALCARNADEARILASELGSTAIGRCVDVADASSLRDFIVDVERTWGHVDILVNNAAIMPIGNFDDEDEATTRRVLDVNLRAVIASTQHAARAMRRNGSGHIVNVASAAGWVAGGGAASYCASKFGVVGYSEAAALELAGSGVYVSVVAPGVIETELSAGVREMRGLRTVTADEVAATIVDVLRYPRFVAFVPAGVGVLTKISAILPYRLRHGLLRLTKTDKAVLQADMASRASYEKRAVAPVKNHGSGDTAAGSHPVRTSRWRQESS